jgi:hypothetical protein
LLDEQHQDRAHDRRHVLILEMPIIAKRGRQSGLALGRDDADLAHVGADRVAQPGALPDISGRDPMGRAAREQHHRRCNKTDGVPHATAE